MIRKSFSFKRHERSGFTLLEVLLTVLLSMILLAGLWSLSNIYLRTFERGQDLVEETQLLRAIQQQINDDLQALAVRPVSEPHSTSLHGFSHDSYVEDPDGQRESAQNTEFVPDLSSGISYSTGLNGAGDANRPPVYSIKGSATSMNLVILRETFSNGVEEPDPTVESAGSPLQHRLPNWRVVSYQFVPRTGGEYDPDSSENPEHPTGLSRIEIAWEDLIGTETTYDHLMQTDEPRESLLDLGDSVSPHLFEPESDADDFQRREERIDLPQFIACRFRYYDGSNWQSDWDSGTSRVFPVAVELKMQIQPTGAARRERLAQSGSRTVETIAEDDEDNTVLQEPILDTNGEWPVFRQVFYITNGGSSWRFERLHQDTIAPNRPLYDESSKIDSESSFQSQAKENFP